MKSAGTFLSLVCILVLGIAAFFFYSRNQSNELELLKLRAEVAEVAQLREEVEALRARTAQVDQVERLQKEATEIYKLRNEVRQLQKDKQALYQQFSQRQNAQVDLQNQAQAQQAELLQKENDQLRQENEDILRARVVGQIDTCIANLRQLDGAKEQWALEHRKAPEETPAFEDLIGPDKYIKSMPACPGNGNYTLNAVSSLPTCNIPGHQIQE